VRVLVAILRREWRASFRSPQAGIMGSCFLFLAGALSLFNLDAYLRASAQIAVRMRGMGRDPIVLDYGENLLRQDLGGLALLVLLYLPLLAMNLLAEERRSGTLELLMTSPVGDGRLVFGKWLAAQIQFVGLLLLAMLPKLVFLAFAELPWATLIVGLAGISLMSGAFLAIALFLGSLTRSPLIAAAGGFAVILLLWILGGFVEPGAAGFPGGFLTAASATGHLEPLLGGLLDSWDLLYFVLVTVIGLELSRRGLQALRGSGR